MEIYVTYKCGCEYSSGCYSSGEGFESYCDQHVEEADHFQDTMYTLMDERMKHRSNSEDSKDVNDRFFPTGKVSDLARERRKFHNKIMGN